jgi:carboxyl-terminal processing protease
MEHLQEDIAKSKRERERNVISLNEADRRKDRAAQEALLASRKSTDQAETASLPESIDAARDDGLQPNERSLSVSVYAEKVSKNTKDIFLMEAARILSDEIDVAKAEPQLAVGSRISISPRSP